MPAPTALIKPAFEPEAVPLPTNDQDDEMLLDASAALPENSVELQPTHSDDTEMIVDEEGRPRFAPAKEVVWDIENCVALNKRGSFSLRTQLCVGSSERFP